MPLAQEMESGVTVPLTAYGALFEREARSRVNVESGVRWLAMACLATLECNSQHLLDDGIEVRERVR